MAPLAINVTRKALRAAGNISPSFAGKLAFDLFCRTPPKTPKHEKAKSALARAERRMDEAERTDLRVPGGQIAAFKFLPHDPGLDASEPVLVVHGWGSRTEHMLGIIEGLRHSGRTVVSIDLPGHGQSSGRRLHLGRAVHAIDAAWRQYGPFQAMVGHSFGAPAMASSAIGALMCVPARRPEKMVIIAAPNSLPKLFQWFGKTMQLSAKVQAALEANVLRIAGRPLSMFVGSEMLGDTQIPTLAIHAPDDKEVPFSDAQAYASCPNVELVAVDGLGHRRIVNSPRVIRLVREFCRPNKENAAKAA